ncbi:MAG: hypothetical protein BWX79_03052 [Alphaproteobacteria bacterium ADurb.Bin100]|nr:MAG: hypothetical protein BWX79_03052 [Alphaproteobacteria bacterium ADurb.Bin100]
MLHHTGQVDGGLDAGVAAADDGHVLALEQRAVAVRAVGHALVPVLRFARYVDVAPARAGGQDHGFRLQRAAVGQLQLGQTAGLAGGDELVSALQVHDVHVVGAGVGFECGGKLGAVGFEHRDVVLDRQRVVDLPAEALGRHTGADALARGIDRGGRAGRATADDQHVVRRLGAKLGRVPRSRTRVELGDDFFHAHAAGAEHGAVQEDHGHRHDFAGVDLVLEGAAFDHGGLDLGVQDGHEAERLHHVRAVVAAQGHVDLEVEVTVQRLDLLDHLGLDLGRVAAGPQQGQHQRREFMAQRQTGEAQAVGGARALQRERRLASIGAIRAQRDLVGAQGLDGLQQVEHLARGVVVAQSGHQLERLRHALQIGCELGLEGIVEHGVNS